MEAARQQDGDENVDMVSAPRMILGVGPWGCVH